MQFHGYSIYLGEKKIGEMIPPLEDPRKVCESFLEKTGGFIGAGIRRVIEDEPGLLRAERVEGT